jgi:hypothetical protein
MEIHMKRLQYVSDERGNITGVIVPIVRWREIQSEKETAYLFKSRAMNRSFGDDRAQGAQCVI